MRSRKTGAALILSLMCLAAFVTASCTSLPVINADGQKTDVPGTHEFNIRTEEAGYYDISYGHGTESGGERTTGLFIGDHFLTGLSSRKDTVTVYLDKGNNKVSLRRTEGSGEPYIDSVTVNKSEHKTVMVIAPHEDDEILAFAGSIMAAAGRGDTVKVVLMTNGDYFGKELAEVRIAESAKALEHLGIGKEDIIVMGYGDVQIGEFYIDGSSDEVRTSHAGLTSTSGAPSLGIYDYHLLDKGEHASYTSNNFRGDLENIIRTVRPDEIYTVSEYEWHPDHKYSCLITRDVIKSIQKDTDYHPVVYQSVVHGEEATWPERLKTDSSGNPDVERFTYPFPSGNVPLEWNKAERIYLTADMIKAKYDAIGEFVTQNEGTDKFDGNSGFNYAFVKADEFYWPEKY